MLRPTELSAERYTRFLLALLQPRAATGGWVKPRELAAEVGCSRATAYRLISKAESAGVPIVRDSEQGGGGAAKPRRPLPAGGCPPARRFARRAATAGVCYAKGRGGPPCWHAQGTVA
jgi:predicted DNA-binding transcriptional regulator YafY